MHLVEQGESDGSGAPGDVFYGGQVVGGHRGVLGEKLDQRRNEKHRVGPVLRQDLQEHPRLKRGHDDLGRTVAEPVGHDDVEPANVEEREEEQGGGLVLHEPDGGVVQLGHVGNQVGMGEPHSFWPPCGARAVRQPASGGRVNGGQVAGVLIVGKLDKRGESELLMSIGITFASQHNLSL